jgi:hypothetical protein
MACALKFDDFHGWARSHLRACYLLCLMETSSSTEEIDAGLYVCCDNKP